MPPSSRPYFVPSDSDNNTDIDSDIDSWTSLPPFSPSPSTDSYTSYDVSMRSESPAPSVLSMTSSMRAQAFKQEFGRGLNNYSEVYRLPADDEELDRLSAYNLISRIYNLYQFPGS